MKVILYALILAGGAVFAKMFGKTDKMKVSAWEEDLLDTVMLRISTTRDRRGDVVIKVQGQSEQPGMSRDQRKV